MLSSSRLISVSRTVEASLWTHSIVYQGQILGYDDDDPMFVRPFEAGLAFAGVSMSCAPFGGLVDVAISGMIINYPCYGISSRYSGGKIFASDDEFFTTEKVDPWSVAGYHDRDSLIFDTRHAMMAYTREVANTYKNRCEDLEKALYEERTRRREAERSRPSY